MSEPKDKKNEITGTMGSDENTKEHMLGIDPAVLQKIVDVQRITAIELINFCSSVSKNDDEFSRNIFYHRRMGISVLALIIDMHITDHGEKSFTSFLTELVSELGEEVGIIGKLTTSEPVKK